MDKLLYAAVAREMSLQTWQVENTAKLFDDGATVPFVSRYRKEMTGSLDEVAVTAIRDRLEQIRELEKRKASVIESVKEQGKLTPELEKQFLEAATMTELEDLYLPYRPKRKTRATIAMAKGLEPLAKWLMLQRPEDIYAEAEKYINTGLEVNDADEALAGACDIIAEWVNEHQKSRKIIRDLFIREAVIRSKVAKGKEKEGDKYENYFAWEEPVMKSPSHRILAMFRGENEGFLKVSVGPSDTKAIEMLEKLFVRGAHKSSEQMRAAVKDGYKRLLAPSIETEIRNMVKEKADEEAIRVFAENVRQLLMASPLGQKTVLAIDPGFRTGCKVVCLDKQGKLLHNETIYPHPPEKEVKGAINKLEYLVEAYKIEAIAIGNGTAGRETEQLVRHIRFKREVVALVVNESGASVYSASSVAREEFPDYDITVRGAVSIGRRLMDPLAELVKIDPKSIGVGQYQHDVNQANLNKTLQDVVESCVNQVGVEVNTASKQLLTYASGLGPVLAGNIIEHRNKNGAFGSRAELKKVPRLGEKAFEQAAGFLRIRDSENMLDRSAVHPESYHVVEKMAERLQCTVVELIEKEELRKQIDINDFVTEKTGLPTLKDIMQELAKPGRDPRQKFDFFEFDKNVFSVQDLKIGMILPGIVTNITNFGAFVDVGVHQDGLVHISQLANRFVSDPNEIVKINQKVMVKITGVEVERKRITLSMKDVDEVTGNKVT